MPEMWHNNGESDLDWQPEMQAERRIASEMLGQASMYLTSVNSICTEEFDTTGRISQESKDKLNEAYKRRHEVIAWLSNLALRIHEVEQ